jgi:hypothetical protein
MTWCCLVIYRQEICTNQPAPTRLPELLVFIIMIQINIGRYYDLFCYSVGIAWLFSIRLLCKRIELAYCMAIMFIFLNVWSTLFLGILNVCSSCFIDGACVVPLAVNYGHGIQFDECTRICIMSNFIVLVIIK